MKWIFKRPLYDDLCSLNFAFIRFLNASFLFSYGALYRIKGPFVPILRKIVKQLLSSRYIFVFCIMLFDVDLYRLPRADNGEMDRERER